MGKSMQVRVAVQRNTTRRGKIDKFLACAGIKVGKGSRRYGPKAVQRCATAHTPRAAAARALSHLSRALVENRRGYFHGI